MYTRKIKFREVLAVVLFISSLSTVRAQEQVYEFRTYEFTFFGNAQLLHDYFEQALIPALNRQGIEQVGVFEETGMTLPKKVYLLVAHDDIAAFQNSADQLLEDKQYQKDAEAYLKADPSAMPYTNISTDLIRSTTGFPKLVKRDGAEYLELRIYTSYNEDALRRKVKMFNDSEFGIFDDVGLPLVFFGHNIAGNNMPCLTYLLGFKDEEARGEAWSKFGPHPEWQRIVGMEEYADAMNDIIRVFLKPVPYSQL